MERVKRILDGEDVIISSFPEDTENLNSLYGMLMGKIITQHEPNIPPGCRTRRMSALTYICNLLNADAEETNVIFRITILNEDSCNVDLSEGHIFYLRNPKIVMSSSIPGQLSIIAKISDIAVVERNSTLNEQGPENQEGLSSISTEQEAGQSMNLEPKSTLNEQGPENQEEVAGRSTDQEPNSSLNQITQEGSSTQADLRRQLQEPDREQNEDNQECSNTVREGLRRRIKPQRRQRNMRFIFSEDSTSSMSEIFYSEGTFTYGAIINLLSDEVCLGYCSTCKDSYCYSEFIWRASSEETVSTPSLPYCPFCVDDEMNLTTLLVFFECFMKFEVEGSDDIEVLFQSKTINNFLGIRPVNYASDATVRGTFRFEAANLLTGTTRIGYCFTFVDEVCVPLLVSVEKASASTCDESLI